MDHPLSPSRRAFFATWGALSAVLALPHTAAAKRRPNYSGSLRLHLPLNVTSIDPHDPHDLTTRLLGNALFETLYARSTTGTAYPTLAASLPRLEKGRCLVELRPGLSFASGTALDASQVVASLNRAKQFSPWLQDLGTVVSTGPRGIAFSQRDPRLLTRLLSSSRTSLLPKGFSPTAPDTCGAFRVEATGTTLHMKRNPRAPRGGSFLDEVWIESASVSDCLRAFEARRSDLGFLGAGLHRERRDVKRFAMKPVGLALLLPGGELRARTPVGTLHEMLARLPQAQLSALGVERPRHSPRRWNGGDADLVVPAEEPWLVALAEDMASALSTKGHFISVKKTPSRQIPILERSGAFDLMLRFFGTQGVSEEDTTRQLFRLDDKPAPRGGRTLSPLESGRQLSLGIVGAMTPRGALTRDVSHVTGPEMLTLENAERLPS